MRGSLIALSMLLCGCDTVFMLERPDALIIPVAPVIIDPDLDADDDGDPNATDLCPLAKNTEFGADEDTDGDGVGNLCDPAPLVPGDCLALFDVFEGPGPLSSHWKSSGASIIKDDGQMVIPPSNETVVYLDVEFPMSSLTAFGYIPGGVGARRAIQLMFEHDRLNGVTGRACGAERDDPPGSTSRVSLVEIENGVETPLTSSPLNDIPIGAGTTILIGWNDRHPGTGESSSGRCHAELMDQMGDMADTGLEALPPTGGAFALRTKTVGFNVYGVVGYGHNCISP